MVCAPGWVGHLIGANPTRKRGPQRRMRTPSWPQEAIHFQLRRVWYRLERVLAERNGT